MKKINVCIIGCGMIANKAHIPAYLAEKNDYEILAVCDFNIETAKKTAEKFGIKHYYSSAEEMLHQHSPDLVSVCTPNLLHKDFVKQALLCGANVLCEKPLATSYKDAKELFDLANEKGKVLMACQSLRFLPERLAAFQMVKNGEVGEVYYAEANRIRRRGIPTWGKFHIKSANGGGAFLDIGVHAIDSAIWLMDNPKPKIITASINKVHVDEIGSDINSGALKGGVDTSGFNPDEMDVESFASGNITFQNGASLNFKISWAANIKEENNIIISGKKSGIDIENKKIYYAETTEDLTIIPNGFLSEPFYGHFCIIKNMADVLLRNGEPFIKPEETLNVTAIIEAAYLSAENGRSINICEL